MLLIVHADSDYFYIQLLKLACFLRQTAQFRHAERSPVPAVEIEKHPGAVLLRKSKRVPVLVLQAEIRCRLACRRGGLWLGVGSDLAKRRSHQEDQCK